MSNQDYVDELNEMNINDHIMGYIDELNELYLENEISQDELIEIFKSHEIKEHFSVNQKRAFLQMLLNISVYPSLIEEMIISIKDDENYKKYMEDQMTYTSYKKLL